MLIRLIRNQPKGKALTGTLYVDSLITEEGIHQYQLSMHTLEHMDYAIPNGFYRLRMTYSPRFQEILPLLDHVFGYAFPNMRSPRTSWVSGESGGTCRPNVDAVNSQCDHVAERLGIRIHAGNSIEHTTGCILVGDLSCVEDGSDAASTNLIASSPLASSPDRLLSSRKRLEELRNYLLNYQKQNPYEEIYIQLASPDPYPYADIACSYEQQAHIAESLERARTLRCEQQ